MCFENKKIIKKKDTCGSNVLPNRSTKQASWCLTLESRRDLVLSSIYDTSCFKLTLSAIHIAISYPFTNPSFLFIPVSSISQLYHWFFTIVAVFIQVSTPSVIISWVFNTGMCICLFWFVLNFTSITVTECTLCTRPLRRRHGGNFIGMWTKLLWLPVCWFVGHSLTKEVHLRFQRRPRP